MFCAFRLLKNQVIGKLNYAHIGMSFIYRGMVSGSSGLMSLDMLPVSKSFTPKRFLNDAFVNLSPWIYIRPPCETGETINMNDSHNSDG